MSQGRLRDRPPNRGWWCVPRMVCDCGREWTDVCPEAIPEVECPGCGRRIAVELPDAALPRDE